MVKDRTVGLSKGWEVLKASLLSYHLTTNTWHTVLFFSSKVYLNLGTHQSFSLEHIGKNNSICVLEVTFAGLLCDV